MRKGAYAQNTSKGTKKKMIKNRVFKNAAWIIGCRIVHAVLHLAVTMISARFLSPSGYGLINYAASVTAFLLPVMQLGLNAILVHEILSKPEKEGETLGSAMLMSLVSGIMCVLGAFAFTSVANAGETETIIVCTLYSCLLVTQSAELLQYYFQAKLISKYASMAMLVGCFTVSVYKIALLVAGMSVYYFAIAQALDYLIIGVALILIYRIKGTQKLRVSAKSIKSLFSKGKYYVLSALMTTFIAQSDKIIIKLTCGDSEVGFYTGAFQCAIMTNFVFGAIIDSARTSILESKMAGDGNFETNMKRLYSLTFYLSLLQNITITLLAPIIVGIICGSEYTASVNMLRIVVWYTSFSYMGSVRDVWILAEEKHKYLWVINLFGAVFSFALNMILIPVLGGIGAAIVSVCTQFFTNFLVGFIVPPIRRNNTLFLQSLNPKYLVSMVRSFLGKEKE